MYEETDILLHTKASTGSSIMYSLVSEVTKRGLRKFSWEGLPPTWLAAKLLGINVPSYTSNVCLPTCLFTSFLVASDS